MKLFGQRLRELRKEKDLSLEALAEIFNTTNQTISRWELGQNQPDYETLVEVAKYFNVRTDYLLGLED